jgi:ABC-type multidrug transport system fused ATPase/permease subunit
VGGLGALSLASYSNAMTPRLIKSVIDNTSSKDGTSLTSVRQQRAAMVRAFGIFTAGSIGSYVRTRAFGMVAANVGQRLRVALFSSLVAKERSFFDGRKSASLVDALINDVEEVEKAVTQSVGNVLRYTSSLVTGTSMILSISGGGMMLAKFAGMSMVLMPVVAIAGAKQNKKVKAARLAGDEQRVESTSFAAERLGAIQTVHRCVARGERCAVRRWQLERT